jgi:hypothetical protein
MRSGRSGARGDASAAYRQPGRAIYALTAALVPHHPWATAREVADVACRVLVSALSPACWDDFGAVQRYAPRIPGAIALDVANRTGRLIVRAWYPPACWDDFGTMQRYDHVTVRGPGNPVARPALCVREVADRRSPDECRDE